METTRYEAADFGAPIAPVRREVDPPEGAEVIVAVSHCGVCHSDIHIHEGGYGIGDGKVLRFADRGLSPPLVLGHEIVGTVAAVGPDADPSLLGRRFLVFPWIGCGACATCASGEEHLCNKARFLGVFRPGGFAEHVRVPHARYLLDIEGLDPAKAATCACAGLTAFGAIRRIGEIGPDDWVAVIGAGGLGQTAVALLAAQGHDRIVAVDPDGDKRGAAERLGAALTFAPGEDTAKAIVKATGGGARGAIDFVGAEDTALLGINAIRKGGTYVVVGLFGGELRYPIPFVTTRAIRIAGSYVGSLADLEAYVALVKEKGLPPIAITERPMAEAGAVLADLEAGRVPGRAVLVA